MCILLDCCDLRERSLPAQTIEQIVLMGNPQITGDALTYALDLGMPVHYLTYFGKYLGSALPGYSRNGQLRLAQFQLHQNTVKRLALVKASWALLMTASGWVTYKIDIIQSTVISK